MFGNYIRGITFQSIFSWKLKTTRRISIDKNLFFFFFDKIIQQIFR